MTRRAAPIGDEPGDEAGIHPGGIRRRECLGHDHGGSRHRIQPEPLDAGETQPDPVGDLDDIGRAGGEVFVVERRKGRRDVPRRRVERNAQTLTGVEPRDDRIGEHGILCHERLCAEDIGSFLAARRGRLISKCGEFDGHSLHSGEERTLGRGIVRDHDLGVGDHVHRARCDPRRTRRPAQRHHVSPPAVSGRPWLPPPS